ncbi:COG3427 Carbon monoxide dehydrogenase subunit G, CoxG [Burkholderiaceae bacterium]
MDMQGNRQLGVSQQQAWDALNDPMILKACIPGCEKFELIADNQYAVIVAVKIGPVAAKFNGKVTLADIQAPASYSLQFEAQGGVAGFGQGESKVELVANEGGCELRYAVHSKVGGKIAQLGQRLIDGVAKSLAEDFFKRFELALQEKYPEAANILSSEDQEGGATQEVKDSAPKFLGIPKWLWPYLLGFIAGSFVSWVMR